MPPRLSLSTILLLLCPPLLWAGNAVAGRVAADLLPPLMLNLLRWVLAFALLAPLGWHALRTSSGLWAHWQRYALLGLLGVGCYNAFMYLALTTSTPVNVTLVAASTPVWMLLVGRIGFGAAVRPLSLAGAALSLCGVAVVLSHGQWERLLGLRLVAGDLYMLAASLCWAWYSWLLTRTHEPAAVRQHWAGFQLAQMVFGLAWSAVFAAGEQVWAPGPIHWGWPLAAVLLYVAIGPAILAYRAWGLGVQRVGPSVASMFGNLTPLFAAVLSAAFLGEHPQAWHALAFALIVCGIWASSRAR